MLINMVSLFFLSFQYAQRVPMGYSAPRSVSVNKPLTVDLETASATVSQAT